MLKKVILGLAVVAFTGIGAAMAQAPAPAAAPSAIKRTPLQDVDFPAGYHVVTVIAEIAANTESAGRHTHPGVDTGYVLEGEATLTVEGKPDQILKAGDSYQIPPGVPHDLKTGAKSFKIVGIYIVEKGKPVASPAPK